MPERALSISGRPAEWYYQLYRVRREAQDPQIKRMRDIQAVMNDDIELNLSEIDEHERPAVANLAQQGCRQLGQRIASIDPTVYFPSHKPGDETEDQLCVDRGNVVRGWREDNNLRLVNAMRARHFLAYACMPIVIRPDPVTRLPRWFVQHPLQTFPADGDFFQMAPDDVIFQGSHSYAYFLRRYPTCAGFLNKPWNWEDNAPDLNHHFTVIEYLDDYESTIVAVGSEDVNPYGYSQEMQPRCMILESTYNFAERTPAVIPGSISLDKQRGHFDGIIGMYQAQATLMALSMIATKRAIFRPAWAVSNPNEVVNIISTPDPSTGEPGEISGGQIQWQDIDPSMTGIQVGDQLEYAARMTAGLPSEFGGMSPTNVRTGRRGAQVMANTVDFTISEAQDVFAAAAQVEHHIAMAIDKGYFGSKKKYHVVTRSFNGVIDYTPSKLWTKGGIKHKVDYPMGGVDLQNLPIEGGQRVQMKTMSRRRFMDIDPAIPDPDAEEQRMVVEAVNDAFINSILAMAQDPTAQAFQPADIAKLKKYVLQDMSLEDAVIKVNEEAQARQAQEVPPGDPLAQPGMAQPGMGAESPAAAPADPMADMTQLLGQLGTVQQAGNFRASNGSI